MDKIAYVSYNVQGEVHDGALEVLDLTIPGAPVVLSTAFFENVDINDTWNMLLSIWKKCQWEGAQPLHCLAVLQKLWLQVQS